MLSFNTNLAALTARTNLQGATNAQTKSIQRLSTGLRINHASDDASGLAISEKMRTQIRGLKKASENSQNGISMLQTAEGALNETQSILQRMRELAVQASNGTLTSNDRIEVQKEVDALKDEIDGISTRTEFNTKKLLTGDATGFASFSTSQMKANFYGPHVKDGEYQLEVNAIAGKGEVQTTSMFRVKDGVQSVESQDLNASPARHKMSFTLDGANTTTGNYNIKIDGVDYGFTSNIDGTDLATTQSNLQTAFFAAGGAGADAGLSSKMNLTINGNTVLFTAKDANVDFTFKVDETGAGNNLAVGEEGLFNVTHRSSANGISEFTNLNNLIDSPTSDASYKVVVDEKGDGSMVLDNLETVSGQDANGGVTYDDDIYHIIGTTLQAGSTGLREAYLDYPMTLSGAGGAGNAEINFSLDGNPSNIVNFQVALGGADANTDAVTLANAINADNRLNQFIKAEASTTTGEVKFYALDQHKALDYKMQMVGDDGANAALFTQIAAGEVDDAQFVTGLGKLGATADTAFTANSNSHSGTSALIEFATDGSIGSAGLDAKVSFDGGSSWTYVENIWDGSGTDKTATDGYYSLDFNNAFTNDGLLGSFKAGDRVMIAMNDNANTIPDTTTYNTTSLDITDSATDSNLSLKIDVAGEVFNFNTNLEGASKTEAQMASDLISNFNSQIGSNGTKLSDVMSISYDSGTHKMNFTALKDDFTMTHSETGGNITTADGSVTKRFQATDGDLTRVDAFDPTTGQFEMGVVTSHPNNSLDDSNTTLKVSYFDETSGQASLGSVDAKFSLAETGTLPTDGTVSFTANKNGGGDVQAATKLRDIDRFYNADGQFILGQNGETFSIYNAYGDKSDVYIDGGDSLRDVVNKLKDVITNDVVDGGLGMSTGNSELDENIVSFVKESIPNSTESQQGSIVIRSPKSGANGRLFISGSEALKTALGISNVDKAEENELEITVNDALTGEFVGRDVTSDNILHNIVKGVDIEIDQNYDIKATFDESSKSFVFESDLGRHIETMRVVDNSTDFQIGANQGQTLNTNIMQADAHALKVDRVQVTDQDEAKEAITQVDNAIIKVSSARAKIGAWVNRLEHTINNLGAQEENQTAAESRIRDLNIAQETTKLSKSQILAQSSTSMLAQANQQAQGLMALLR